MIRCGVVFVACVAFAGATTIDFEAQGSSAPSSFSSPNSPLTIGIATFMGGQLLKNETAVAPAGDVTAVYATAGPGVSARFTDPLTINFSQPVSNVGLLLTNEVPDTYTVADNLGGSESGTTSQMFSLSDTGVTQVTIASATAFAWDFAIDNVTFTPAVTTVPEPAMWLPMGLGLLTLLIGSGRRDVGKIASNAISAPGIPKPAQSPSSCRSAPQRAIAVPHPEQ